MVRTDVIYSALEAGGVDFFTGVPDSLLADFCAYVTDRAPEGKHVIAANEGVAVGIAAGHYLASGRTALVYMQNSGQGNAVNPLLSLADEKVYAMPMLLMIGWRGEPGTKDEPQHVKQGEVTLTLLDAMGIPYIVLSDDETVAVAEIGKMAVAAREQSRPHAIVIRKGVFEKYTLKKRVSNDYPMSREDALQIVAGAMGEDDITVSTTGKLSRELFEYRERAGQGHERDFLTVGSMGHGSSIALGIAMEKPDRRVWCLDGDGAFIMHMGAVTGIGNIRPANYRHIVFNNGAHESVGGQPTVAFGLDIPSIAMKCGYADAYRVSDERELAETLSAVGDAQGPVLIEIRVNVSSRSDLGRPTTTPVENKNAYMDFLKK